MSYNLKNWWLIVNEHTVIRETVGYDVVEEMDLIDMPVVLDFLQIVQNYTNIHKILKEEKII